MARTEGQHTMTILWDMEKFFDSINVAARLLEEAKLTGFPMQQLALSLIVHHSPRRLKMGDAIGSAICDLGRSITAGCSSKCVLPVE